MRQLASKKKNKLDAEQFAFAKKLTERRERFFSDLRAGKFKPSEKT